MSGTVISTYTTAGLVLTNASQNPVTITTSGEINSSATNAISGSNLAAPWTIENYGTLESTRQTLTLGGTIAVGVGISLAGSGTIINGSAADPAADITGSANGIVIASGSVENYGTIHGGADYGLRILGASHVINGSNVDTTAYIGGDRGGVWGFASGYLLNFGTILATVQSAINFGDGLNNTIINGSATDTTALIESQNAGVILETGTLTNYGTVVNETLAPSSYGAAILQNGFIFNDGLIEGGAGVSVGAGSTLVNAGTIIGNAGTGTAVYFEAGFPSQTSTLIVDPGAEFFGTVKGRATVTMELASAAGSGTISGLGTQFTDIETISIDTGASWVISGHSAGLAAGQTITGFGADDTLVLDGFTATSSIVSGDLLTLSNGASTETLDIARVDLSQRFQISDVAAGTEVITICYLLGTRILTARGEVAVEELAIGDMVVTRFGGMRPVKWIGRQSFSPPFLGRQMEQLPVRITAGALGGGLPLRDLFVSPGHSVLLGEVLVLAKHLVNGVTVTQDAAEVIEYYNIELEGHDCILADGVWAESYADAPGMRAAFQNAAEFWALYPDYVTPEEVRLCAARPETGERLEAALMPVVAQAAALLTPGALRGFIDRIGVDGLIEGWAQDVAHPELPVLLEVLCRNEMIGNVLAYTYRADVAQAGFGNGRCGFTFQAPSGLEVTVRRAGDNVAPQDLAA